MGDAKETEKGRFFFYNYAIFLCQKIAVFGDNVFVPFQSGLREWFFDWIAVSKFVLPEAVVLRKSFAQQSEYDDLHSAVLQFHISFF